MKRPLHQETATSSRNGHIIKKRPLHQKTTFFDEVTLIPFCRYISYVILCRTWWSAPFLMNWELYQEMATSSRNDHFIKKWPLHQETATSSNSGRYIEKEQENTSHKPNPYFAIFKSILIEKHDTSHRHSPIIIKQITIIPGLYLSLFLEDQANQACSRSIS